MPIVPPQVLARVKDAVRRLHECHFGLTSGVNLDQMFNGQGRYLADAWDHHGMAQKVASARADLQEFRRLAATNGVDAEAIITTLGGEPELPARPKGW